MPSDDTAVAATKHLGAALHAFQDKVRAQPRLKTLLKDWNRHILVEPFEAGDVVYTLRFANGEIAEILPGRVEDGGETVHLRGTEETLLQVFLGHRNPAGAFLGGELEVFASDRDQTKLDVIALVLWAD